MRLIRAAGCHVAALLCIAALSGCASPPACPAPQTPAIHDMLVFGSDKPDGSGPVGADEWSAFLASDVTPRFPQGLTVQTGQGQWRGADGRIVKEWSQVLHLVHPDDAASEVAVAEIAAAYKSRFVQEAVLRIKSRVCMSI